MLDFLYKLLTFFVALHYNGVTASIAFVTRNIIVLMSFVGLLFLAFTDISIKNKAYFDDERKIT